MTRSRRIRNSPTIHDVARAAGVSPSTVSNALNGRTHAMAEDTLARIQGAIKALRYRPNWVARGLVTSRTATIGLVLAEIETPLFLQALPHMELVARQAGHNLLLCGACDREDEEQTIGLLLQKQVDGIIFFSRSEYQDDTHLLELQRLGVPLVLVNRAGRHASVTQVNWDQTQGVAGAVDYLAGLGHRRIAHLLGPAVRHSTAERLEGYRRGLSACGIDFRDDYLRPGDFTGPEEGWLRSVSELLDLPEPPTAIIASDDVVATGVVKGAQAAGLNVPAELSVIGIDDQPFCQYMNPALTTLRLPTVEAGKLATELLLEQVTGRTSDPQHVLLPCPLVVRASTGRVSKR